MAAVRLLEHVDHPPCRIVSGKQFMEFFTFRRDLGAALEHGLLELMKSGFQVIGMQGDGLGKFGAVVQRQVGSPLKAFTALGKYKMTIYSNTTWAAASSRSDAESVMPRQKKCLWNNCAETRSVRLAKRGIILRRGLVPLTERDLDLIAQAMHVDLTTLRNEC